MSALGAILVRGASIWQSIAGNITTTRKFLRQTGTGSVSALPAWDTLVNGDLPTSAVTPGSYTNTNLTVNAQGIVTAAANGSSGGGGTVTTTGSPANGNLTKFTGATSISNADLTGDVTTSGTVATTLANTAVTPGTYGDATHVAQVTVDSKGRLTAASNVAISGGGTTPALQQIQQIITSGSQTTVDFSSIPATFTGLKVIYSSRDTAAGTSNSVIRIKINNDATAGNYSSTGRIGSSGGAVFATGVAASTKGVWGGIQPNDGNTAGDVAQHELTLNGYATSGLQRMMVLFGGEADGTNGFSVYSAFAFYTLTNAVNQITFGTDGTAFKNGMVFTLYGVL